jgi:hypothetical protein
MPQQIFDMSNDVGFELFYNTIWQENCAFSLRVMPNKGKRSTFQSFVFPVLTDSRNLSGCGYDDCIMGSYAKTNFCY